MSLRNLSRVCAGAQASQSAPDLRPGLFKIKRVSSLRNSDLPVVLFDKVRLHFLTGFDQGFGCRHSPLSAHKIRILPGLDLFGQILYLLPQFADRVL